MAVPYEAPRQEDINIPTVVPQEDLEDAKAKRKAQKAAEKERKRKEKEAREQAEAEAKRQQKEAQAADETAVERVEQQVVQDTSLRAEQPARQRVDTTSAVAVVAPVVAPVIQALASEMPKTAPAPIFKVQILACGTRLPQQSPQLKGQQADCYQEGGMYKYTVGSSTNYNEILQLRKTLTDRFPEAFVIAFKNGKRMDVREAIKEFKANKKQ